MVNWTVIGWVATNVVTLIGGGLIGQAVSHHSSKKQQRFDEQVLQILREHCRRPGAPIFSADDIQRSFFPKARYAKVLSSLLRWEQAGVVKRVDIGTLDGPGIGWLVMD